MIIRKALTFRASSIGDCLMGKYLLENVHAAYPDARFGVVVSSRGAMIRDLFAAYPWLEVIEANRRDPQSLLRLWRDWRGSDLVVTQYAGKPGGRFSFASKVAARLLARRGGLVGFTDAWRSNRFLYDHLVSFRGDTAPAALEREALRVAGVPISLERPMMQYAPISRVAEKFGIAPGSYLIVHLFSGNAGRGLHPDKKRALLRALAEEIPDTHLVVSGGVGDREEALTAARGLPASVIAGDATLQELMNLIAGSAGVVSVDTGIAHIAAQIGTPLIVLASCLGLHWWGEGQYGPDASLTTFTRADYCVAGHVSGPFPVCLNEIDVTAVARQALLLQSE